MSVTGFDERRRARVFNENKKECLEDCRFKAVLSQIDSLIRVMGLTAGQAMELLDIPSEKRPKYFTRLHNGDPL